MKYKYLLTQPYFDDDEQQKLMESGKKTDC